VGKVDVGKTVLVVDDEAGIRELLRAVLETYGYEVAEAGDGIQALAAIDADPPVADHGNLPGVRVS
jgi:two-component system chemotaxis response regulator CheY